jgi:hypothetical protein
MSVDEMRRLADRLEAELASKARPVKAQSAQVPPANPLDLLA